LKPNDTEKAAFTLEFDLSAFWAVAGEWLINSSEAMRWLISCTAAFMVLHCTMESYIGFSDSALIKD
jgi:hypothetical protein